MAHYGLVLAGGGGKGAYQIGVWDVLSKMGYQSFFDIVVGTSVGALNAALYAQQDLNTALQVWQNISNDKIMTSGNLKLDNLSICSHDGLETIMKVNISQEKIKRNNIRCYVCATNTSRNKELGIVSGEFFCLNDIRFTDFYNALLASSAFPVAFRKVKINESEYRDGGVINENNIPYKKALELGCRKILVVDLRPGVNHTKTIGSSQIMYLYPSHDLGDDSNIISDSLEGILDFTPNGAQHRINLGRQDTLDYMDKIKDFLGHPQKNKQYISISQKDIEHILRGKKH